MSRNHLQDRLQNKSSKKAEGVKRRDLLLGTTSLVAASAISAAAVPRATNAATPEVLPEPEAAFKGKISQTLKDSTPDFPKGVEAPAGAPNVLLILTDDVGFGASSTFGGPIQTPNFQRLADSGLRYTKYALLADKGRADYRAKPPFGGQWQHYRVRNGLSGLQLTRAEERRLRGGGPQG